MPEEDPRLAPGAYISQDRHLYEVISVDGSTVRLENCLTGFTLSTYRESVTGPGYRLEKAAPSTDAPDTVPDDL